MSTDDTTHQDVHPDTRSETVRQQSTSTPIGPDTPDATNASNPVDRYPSEKSGQALVTCTNLPDSILSELQVFCGKNGNTYLATPGKKNVSLLRIGSKQANNYLRRLAHEAGTRLKTNEIRDINDDLIAHAETSADTRDAWYRVALIKDGIEIDRGDEHHTRIRVKCGEVEIISEGSDTLFYRTPGMQPFVMPADDGDLTLLDKYLNLHPTRVVLLKAWLSLTLAHPKVSTTNYVILVLQGDQGSGKSFLCRIIQSLIDPGIVGLQTFPRNPKDLVIAAQHAHVLFYDNIRDIKQLMADMLCIAATGGATTTRQLYTDAEQHVHWLHVALVLNGIHSFIDQSDLAQRSLLLHLLSIDEKSRRSEAELYQEFLADLPRIFRGLLNLTADVLKELPTVEVTSPERMFEFSQWLAAMEKVEGAPPGVYQSVYSDALNEGMLDSLLENPLAAAVMSFVTESGKDHWSGTPADLLHELNFLVGNRARYSHDWPQNPIALSKRLKPLEASLKRQGIEVTLSRGKHRNITITNQEAF